MTHLTAHPWTKVAVLSDDSAATLLTLSGMTPGSSGIECIRLMPAGPLPAHVSLWVNAQTTGKELSSSGHVLIREDGTGGSPTCSGSPRSASSSVVFTGTLSELATASPALGSWEPSGTRTFEVDYWVDRSAPPSVEQQTASVTLAWGSPVPS